MNESFSGLGLLASGADVLAINFQHVLNTIFKWQGRGFPTGWRRTGVVERRFYPATVLLKPDRTGRSCDRSYVSRYVGPERILVTGT